MMFCITLETAVYDDRGPGREKLVTDDWKNTSKKTEGEMDELKCLDSSAHSLAQGCSFLA